jgi:hypothetical protein
LGGGSNIIVSDKDLNILVIKNEILGREILSEDEWISVANWVYENWDIVGGLSFLPRSNHVYQLAPYEEIDEQRYETMKQKFVGIDFAKIVSYEAEDETEMKRELACTSGSCELWWKNGGYSIS